jgi:hypothetical protein
VVWDKTHRLDLVFGKPGIIATVQYYHEWKRQQDDTLAWLNVRRTTSLTGTRTTNGNATLFSITKAHPGVRGTIITGLDMFAKMQAEEYIQQCMELFQLVRKDPSQSSEPSMIPQADMETLESLSEYIALIPNQAIRQAVLEEMDLN